MRLTNLGVWAATDGLSAAEAATFAKRVEAWGYGALWTPEAVGREVFSASAWLLANTTRLIVASGIANIYARDAFAAAAAQKGLNEQSGDRFLLGLGVSHIPLVKDMRQHEYGKPVATMRAYLEGMAAAPYKSVAPGHRHRRCSPRSGPRCWSLPASGRTAPTRITFLRNTPVRPAKFLERTNFYASSRQPSWKLTGARRVPWPVNSWRFIWACQTM